MTDFKHDQIFEIFQFEKLMNFQNLTLKNIKNVKCYNLENLKIINFTVWKINILQFEKWLNCANNLEIIKK